MITPEQLAKYGSEDGEQSALFCWAQQNLSTYPQLKWLFAVPNGGYRDPKTAGKLKATGVKAGVPDICLPISRKQIKIDGWWQICHTLYIELKVPKKKHPNDLWAGATDEQREWLKHLRTQGYAVHVCYGWEDARDRIVEYLNS